jgi:hypothetical protein
LGAVRVEPQPLVGGEFHRLVRQRQVADDRVVQVLDTAAVEPHAVRRPPGAEDQIDDAYRSKYRRYAAAIIDHITSDEARSATIELVPRQ